MKSTVKRERERERESQIGREIHIYCESLCNFTFMSIFFLIEFWEHVGDQLCKRNLQ